MSYRQSNEAERLKKLKEAKVRYDAFVEEDLDKKQIADYFQIALEAQIFVNDLGRILQVDDDLMWGFFDKKYQYTLRRRPIEK